MRSRDRDGSPGKGRPGATGRALFLTSAILLLVTVFILVLVPTVSCEINGSAPDSALTGDFVEISYSSVDASAINLSITQNGVIDEDTYDLDHPATDSLFYSDYLAHDPLVEVARKGTETSIRLFVYEVEGNDVVVNLTGMSDGRESSLERNITVPALDGPTLLITNGTSRKVEEFTPNDVAMAYVVGLEGNGSYSVTGDGYEHSEEFTLSTPTVIEFEVPDRPGRFKFTVGLDPPKGNGSVLLSEEIDVIEATDHPPDGVADEEKDEGAAYGVPVLLLFLTFGGALLAVLAYSRLRQSPFANDNRRRVFEYISAFPGSHFRGISRDLEMKNNCLSHHLRVLMDSNEIKERRDGIYKRYYAYDYVVDPRDIFLSRTRQAIVDAIARHPGATVKEVSETVSMPVQTVSSNLRHLYEEGVVRLERDGKYKHCYLVE